MANNNPYNVKTELTDGIDSIARFSRLGGDLHPQRLVLHELIVQTVSERRVFTGDELEYKDHLVKIIDDAKLTPDFQKLEKSGDYTPEKISAVLDELGLERLPVHDRAKQVMMVKLSMSVSRMRSICLWKHNLTQKGGRSLPLFLSRTQVK